MRTAITNGQVIAFDGEAHEVLDDAVVVLEDDRILEVLEGTDPDEVQADRVIDAGGKLVSPGFVNMHAHASIQGTAIYTLDWGRRDLYNSAYVAYQPINGRKASLTDEEIKTIHTISLHNLLRNGTTTVMELGAIGTSADIFADTAGEIGIRTYTALGYRSASYRFDENGKLHYEWDEEGGRQRFRKALDFIDRYKEAFDGRVRAYLEPRNADTCTPELLQDSAEAAADLGVLLQIHTAQSVFEFQSIVRRHQKTPVQFLADVGILGPKTILGHCVYTTGHSAVAWRGDEDQRLLAETGTSVAHCPLVFNRNGRAFESFNRYQRHGVNLGIGTDTFPQDMINEMRVASFMAKLVEKDYQAGSAWDVFNAATLGGAKALHRDDLGRIAPGAKADLVLIDLNKLDVGPYADPVKILVHVASGRDVDTVIVDGQVVVEGRQLQTLDIDEEELVRAGQRIGEKIWGETEWPRKSQIVQGTPQTTN